MASAIEKELKLISILEEMRKVVIAFSGGTDSTYLIAMAQKVLDENAIAITIKTEYISNQEINEAIKLASLIKIKHRIIKLNALNNNQIAANTSQRCFFCKTEIFNHLLQTAKEYNIGNVIDGSNVDDQNENRPGLVALKNLGIRSPLQEAELSKEEIRELSKRMNLPTWDKPSISCLATGIPYNNDITIEKIEQIEKAELFIKELNIKQFRVRHHNTIARIEVNRKNFDQIILNQDEIISYFKQLGFVYITLDLQGYRTGSLDEALKVE